MAGVRVIAAAEGSASSLQSMVTVYPTSTSGSTTIDDYYPPFPLFILFFSVTLKKSQNLVYILGSGENL